MTPPPSQVSSSQGFYSSPVGSPTFPIHFLRSTLQSFLPLLQQLHGPQSVSPSPLLPVLHFSTTSSSSPVSANIGDHTLCLTIQIISWQHTIQGILLSNNLYLSLLPLVILLLCYLSCIPLRTPLVNLLHFAGFLYSPKCLLLL